MIAHKNYSANEDGRDFIIGDLHGCYNELLTVMEREDFNTQVDRLFSVGDLIDRGKESLLCLKLIQQPWFHPVIGNHEDMMIQSLCEDSGGAYINWMMNGGDWFGETVAQEVELLAEQVKLNVPYAITVATPRGRIGICHAQPPSLDWNDVKAPTKKMLQTMVWGRSWLQTKDIEYVANIGRTFHGHTPINHPTLLGNVAFIDTGAFYTGKLTMMELTADFNKGGRS